MQCELSRQLGASRACNRTGEGSPSGETKKKVGRDATLIEIQIWTQFQLMWGDLYPEQEEKDVIFNGITQYCGRPRTRHGGLGEWDNWKDTEGRKHKGSGVDALEKARRDPLKWGLSHNSAIQGEVPPRPQRVPPPLHPEAISSNSSIVCSAPPPSQQAYGSPLTQDMIMKTQSMLQNVLQTQASMTQASILQAAQTRQARLLLA